MGTFSIWHWIIVLVVVLVLFGGGGKLSKLMGDAGKGINAFKKGLKQEPEDKAAADAGADGDASTKSIEQEANVAASASTEEKDKKASTG
ncbi:MAG: twin-arginine translocase TatA/TatE family subunit [Kiloniellales bacterium]|nr:twin-arginine translocase TatA/TatE family subunit [Kiloniellales bacterium]